MNLDLGDINLDRDNYQNPLNISLPKVHTNSNIKKLSINEGQKEVLRAIFLHEHAEMWTSKVRNNWYKDLIKEDMFSGLQVHHIRYQWCKYHAEFIIRRKVGRSYVRATSVMSQINNVREIILEVILKWTYWFASNPNSDIDIPTDIYELMNRCVAVETATASNTSIDGILKDDDGFRLNTLVNYTQGLFLYYGEMWLEFSQMEQKPDSDMATTPHLVISDLELKHMARRVKFSSEPAPDGPQDIFFKTTWPGQLIQNESYSSLFKTSAKERIRCGYSRPENLQKLKNVIFTSFENACYQTYQRLLIIFQSLDKGDMESNDMFKESEEDYNQVDSETKNLVNQKLPDIDMSDEFKDIMLDYSMAKEHSQTDDNLKEIIEVANGSFSRSNNIDECFSDNEVDEVDDYSHSSGENYAFIYYLYSTWSIIIHTYIKTNKHTHTHTQSYTKSLN